jgi:predicted small integral membrane protein
LILAAFSTAYLMAAFKAGPLWWLGFVVVCLLQTFTGKIAWLIQIANEKKKKRSAAAGVKKTSAVVVITTRPPPSLLLSPPP